jgi:hypothetical protein
MIAMITDPLTIRCFLGHWEQYLVRKQINKNVIA